jgi:hypothetical protein
MGNQREPLSSSPRGPASPDDCHATSRRHGATARATRSQSARRPWPDDTQSSSPPTDHRLASRSVDGAQCHSWVTPRPVPLNWAATVPPKYGVFHPPDETLGRIPSGASPLLVASGTRLRSARVGARRTATSCTCELAATSPGRVLAPRGGLSTTGTGCSPAGSGASIAWRCPDPRSSSFRPTPPRVVAVALADLVGALLRPRPVEPIEHRRLERTRSALEALKPRPTLPVHDGSRVALGSGPPNLFALYFSATSVTFTITNRKATKR